MYGILCAREAGQDGRVHLYTHTNAHACNERKSIIIIIIIIFYCKLYVKKIIYIKRENNNSFNINNVMFSVKFQKIPTQISISKYEIIWLKKINK